MRPSRSGLSLLLLGALAWGSACSDSASNTPTVCTPACRTGFACVNGACVSACNPPCGSGERCDTTSSVARCVAADTDAAVSDAAVTDDVTTPSDLGGDLDVSAPADTGSPVDDVTQPADAGAPTDAPMVTDVGADAMAVACGRSGEPCCQGRACLNGGQCVSSVCVTATPVMNECTSSGECGDGGVCGGPFECGGSRRCYQCEAPPGMGTFGAACMSGSECRSGVCSNRRCSQPCVYGSAGDTACAAAGAGYVCTAAFFRPMMTDPITTLGVCNQRCAANRECAGGAACVPLLDYFADRMDFICAPSTLTGAPGDACNPSGATTCRSLLCVPTSMTAGYCTAPCATDADCPAAAPVCDALTVIRPSGGAQASRGCRPRDM
ncbi:MAG: hypothetical protein R3A52_06350 [Polyangiales bacterium]